MTDAPLESTRKVDLLEKVREKKKKPEAVVEVVVEEETSTVDKTHSKHTKSNRIHIVSEKATI